MDIKAYIYKKEVDWSLLNQGLSVPITVQAIFQQFILGFLARGQVRNIFFILEGKKYHAKLVNQKFDESKYPNHKDVLQIRYNPSSEIAIHLRKVYQKTYDFLKEERTLSGKCGKKNIKIPDDKEEFIAIYMTEFQDVFLLECFPCENAIDLLQNMVSQQNEYEFEKSDIYKIIDDTARIEVRERLVKVRKLDKAIGDSLKSLYDYRCQLCGKNVGEIYNTDIVETHHIQPFAKSLNNDADNQMIICPNHHSIIHTANPIFDYKKLAFLYPNGYEETVVLNRHLG